MQNEKSKDQFATRAPLLLASPQPITKVAVDVPAPEKPTSAQGGVLTSARIKILVSALVVLCVTAFFARNFILGTPVEVYTAVSGELRQTVVASGRVIWPQRVELAAEVTGRVSAIPVVEGQQVLKGQLLIQLEDKDERANVVLALASVAQAEAKVRQQREVGLPTAAAMVTQAQADTDQIAKQLTRISELKTRDFVSQAELETARRNLLVADSKLDSAKLQLDTNQSKGSEAAVALTTLAQARATLLLAQVKLEQDAIRSPADGVLISRTVEQGDIVQAGKILMLLAAQGETQLEVQIDEKNLAKLVLGQEAMGSADAFSDKRFDAEIIYINPGVDASRGSVEVKLRVKNPPSYLRQDMTVSVDIETAKRNPALVIPSAALRDLSSDAPWVMVVRDHHTQHQLITIGLRGDDNVEVLSGIKLGEAVILPSVGLIKTGQHVRVTQVNTR